VTCPHCRAEISADARFCGACGKATAPTESDPHIPLAQVADLAGKEIAGRYRILTKLGEGGMGAVYRGEQISLRRTVAVKLLRPELSANQTLLRRFSAEAEAVAKLSHPNTVNVYDFGQDTDGSLFIAMEFIEGRSLRSAIAKEGPFAPQRALHIAAQVAASLADAHAHRIVHRDLKPDNVMLQDRGRQRDVVRVLDFGIAKLRDDTRGTQNAMTQAGDMLGTPQYMAPEQIKGEAIDGRTDVYALGCMIYEMVTARLPFEAPTIMAMLSKHLIEAPIAPSQRRPDLGLPPAIDQLVLAAMAKDPGHRPPTMDAFGEQIAALAQALPPLDPNRSQQQSAAQPAINVVTPAAPSAYAPPPYATPQPPHAPQSPHAPEPPPWTPPPIPPTTRANPPTRPPPVAAAKSRAPVYAVAAVLVLGGGGAAAYFATRKPATSDAPAPAPGSNGSSASDPWNGGTPSNPPPAGPDPWAVTAREPAAATGDSDTAETAVPANALNVPSTWTRFAPDQKSYGYVDPSTGTLVAIGPLFAGTNDPRQQSAQWTQATGAVFSGMDKIYSAGAQRDAAAFTATINGVAVVQVIVFYVTKQYRVGVIYQATAQVASQDGFEENVKNFFTNSVKLP
jgi:serine/threonine-protein kinase